MRHAISRYSITALIVIAANASAWAQDPDKGRAEFLSRCAECHGADGKGSGPISGKLKARPADLTRLAKKNNGVFSPNAVTEAVDGRSATRPHRVRKCRFGDVGKDLRRVRRERRMNPSRSTPCSICPAMPSRLPKAEFRTLSSISVEFSKNESAERFSPRTESATAPHVQPKQATGIILEVRCQ